MRRLSARLGSALAITALIAVPAFAEDEYNVTSGQTFEGAGLGVHGVDTVGLGTLGAVVPGDAALAVVNDGVTYYFASKITREQFMADPQRYMPQYGGYCAYAVALGKKFDGDPRFADIVDGKLYLFVNAVAFEKYLADKDNTLRMAAEKWPDIQHMRVEDL
ncbi:YHS domain-containing (seleno)protein [Croceicoccus sp. Ery5]|jgi:YHS domain-containing protein|uniref:YHS domain-containing (seleno)protein n=1 Tax=Croceicoccus sp. Ery5 TaxID=1703340 RepID=UPI001E44C378|nr:YHS domain-containing (seleno)protein [Croceicoccus sp. Ery5]